MMNYVELEIVRNGDGDEGRVEGTQNVSFEFNKMGR